MVDRSEFVVTFKAKDLNLTKELREVGAEGAKSGKQVSDGFERGDRSAEKLSANTGKLGGLFSGLQARVVSFGISLAAAFSVRQGFTDTLAFGRAIAEVGTIAGVSADELDALRSKTVGLAAGLGLKEVDVAGGLYQTLSAGITDTAEAFFVLEAAARLAVGGVSTTAQTVDLLTSIINGYGFAATDSARISDQLFETVRLGKTTIDELAASVGGVAPIAATAGVEFTELAAAISTITLSGLSTSEATTQIRAVITALGTRAKELRVEFERVGKTFSFTDIATRGLVPVLQDLRDVVDDDTESLINLLGRQEAVSAVFNLTGQNLKTYNENLRQTAEAQDSVAKSLDVQFDSAAVRTEAQLNALRIRLEEIADSFLSGIAGGAPTSAEQFSQQLETLATPGLEGDAAGFFGTQLRKTGLVLDSLALDASRLGLIIGEAFGEDNRGRIFNLTSEINRLNKEIQLAGFDPAKDFTFGNEFRVEAKIEFDQAELLRGAVEFAKKVKEEKEIEEAFFDQLRNGAERARQAELESIAALQAAEEKLAKSQALTFGEERSAFISQVTTDFDLQREAIDGVVDSEFNRINALLESDAITLTQRESLADLIELIESEKLANIDNAESSRRSNEERRSSVETIRDLRSTLSTLRAELSESGVRSNELTAILQQVQAAAQAADEDGVMRLAGSFRRLLEVEQGFGASFLRGLKAGNETLSQIGENFGSELGGAFSGLVSDLAVGEQGFERFKGTAIRAIAQIIAEFLTLQAVQAASSAFGFSSGGTLSFAGGGVALSSTSASNSLGSLGGKRVNVGAFPTGGVVRDPTLALFGDQSNAYKGEAFVPIPADAKGIPVEFRGPPPRTEATSGMSFTVNMNISAIDSRSLNDRLAQGRTNDLIVGMFREALSGDNATRDRVRDISRGS